MFDDDIDDTYVPVEECARALGITVPEVADLVERGVLQARRYAGWRLDVEYVEVQPAIVVGHTDTPTETQGNEGAEAAMNVTPKLVRPYGMPRSAR